MPSNAYITFLHIRIDVIKLIETHTNYSKSTKGKKNLGHLTRSAVVMLCAAWERYNEDLLIECIDYICNGIADINLLNKEIKKTISRKVRDDKNEIKPIELAGDGWKTIWKNYAKTETELLNTPKKDNLDKLFERYLGLLNYSGIWKNNCSQLINDFVGERGNIAHNGNRATYVRMDTLKKYQDLVVENVIEIDSKMSERVRAMTTAVNLPWIQDYSKDLSYYK
ncbi:MAG: hypothetical protein IPL84_10655 [Chitinophagaceae bacterium]|jgi:hypothetical protein|nr:hypothetical protein [Chitinophagaceae bacterium]